MEGGASAESSGVAGPEKKVAEGTAKDPDIGNFKEGHKQNNLKVPAWVCNKPLVMCKRSARNSGTGR